MVIQIYLIRNIVNGMTYVGQTRTGLKRRFQAHVDMAKKWGALRGPLAIAILEYGRMAFEIEILEEVESQEEADRAEARWIIEFGSLVPDGYNIRPGGAHAPVSDFTKVKIRGRPKSPEHRRKLSEAKKGQKATPAQREALATGRLRRLDNLRDGAVRGSANPRARFSEEEVVQIRLRITSGETQTAVAAELGVNQTTISALVRRRSWSHVA